jgi:hypothetical protein
MAHTALLAHNARPTTVIAHNVQHHKQLVPHATRTKIARAVHAYKECAVPSSIEPTEHNARPLLSVLVITARGVHVLTRQPEEPTATRTRDASAVPATMASVPLFIRDDEKPLFEQNTSLSIKLHHLVPLLVISLASLFNT